MENDPTLIYFLLTPLQIAVFLSLFNTPIGWLLINIVFPLKVMDEFSQIHDRILVYILQDDEDDPCENKNERYEPHLADVLIKHLNNRRITFAVFIAFHISMMACTSRVIGLILVLINIGSFIAKISRFHHFMSFPTKKYAKHVSNPNFVRDGLILTCLSLFLELFGHMIISMISGFGYFLYIGRKEIILMTLLFCIISDLGRRFIGMKIGRFGFANYVAPKMSFEAALFAIFTPSVMAFFVYKFIDTYGYHSWKFDLEISDFINLFGNACGGLSLLGYLLRSFFMRCAGIDDHTSLDNLNLISISTTKVESKKDYQHRRTVELMR